MDEPHADNVVPCPFCAELIDSEATRCHWCRNPVADLRPTHGGRCPACKEVIQKAAILCWHCGEIFTSAARTVPYMHASGGGGCGCSGQPADAFMRGAAGPAGAYPGPVVMQDATRHAASVANGKTRISVPLTQILARAVSGTSRQAGSGGGGGGGGGGGTHCHWRIALEPCTLCFPFTNWCWEDRCLVIEFECTGGSLT